MCSYVILQVRVLYRWLTNQPVNKMHVIDRVPKNKNSALYHLWMLKTKKQRYSKLFSLLCRQVAPDKLLTTNVVQFVTDSVLPIERVVFGHRNYISQTRVHIFIRLSQSFLTKRSWQVFSHWVGLGLLLCQLLLLLLLLWFNVSFFVTCG